MRLVHVSIPLLLLLAGLVPAVSAEDAPAPPKLAPGAEQMDTSVLRPHTAKYRMARGGEDWATAVIELRAAEVAGAPALRHGYSMYFPGQTVYDETLFRRETLAPLVKFIHGGMPPEIAYKLYTFKEKSLSGSTVFADGREPVKLEQGFESAVFGGGTDYLVIATLPLADGYAATLLSADDAGIHPNEIRVEGREMLEVGGKKYETWIVSVQGGMARRWISRELPYLIKLEVPQAGISWELIDVPRDYAYHGGP